jgi:hypothetical protein
MDPAARERVRRLIAAALREAATPEHERIKAELDEWARARLGYEEVISGLPSGRRPDVLRYTRSSHDLFIGDAKNAENETPSNGATIGRIAGYVIEFSRLLTGPSVHGGTIAVATNSEAEANDWVTPLTLFCCMSGIVDGDGREPDFRVQRIGDRTWVTWW